jgi:thiamine kinase-like enzyme
MNAEELALWLEQHLPRVSGLNLRQNVRVKHVLNWGGFVNHSFSVDDGAAHYHLKITHHTDSIRRLQNWLELHDVLEERYRAPELIRWIEFPEIRFAGLLFQHVEGKITTFVGNPMLVHQLIELAGRLHEDESLQCHLNTREPAKTYLDHFVETYIERFTADLEAIRGDRPQFISSALLSWMEKETDRLHNAAGLVPAFQGPALAPVHGDLNEGNVLVAQNDWFVVDWDDLALGDPAIDYAVLLWPMVWEGEMWRDFVPKGVGDELGVRVDVCLRAQLLDEVIDPLADYVEAHAVPSKLTTTQLAKRERHEEALGRYRDVWCASRAS